MKWLPIIPLALGSLLLTAPTLTSQTRRDLNPGSACYMVSLSAPEFDGPAEWVEFILDPAGDPSRSREPTWKLRGPVRADRAALWWPVGRDSLAAFMIGGGGTLWELRLSLEEEVLTGAAFQVIPEMEGRARVRASPTDCRATHE